MSESTKNSIIAIGRNNSSLDS